MSLSRRVLVFGASGAIGSSIATGFLANGCEVMAVARSNHSAEVSGLTWVAWDPIVSDDLPKELRYSFDAVVWAQGLNFNDNIYNFDVTKHRDMYQANVEYILITLHVLLSRDLLASPSRLCLISSIWQNIARQDKLSYTITKSALQGLVQSLAIDLGKHGHLVNAVLPGALDTPMTRNNLSADQIERLERQTPVGKLSTLEDVSNLVAFLCSDSNTGITGQFIAADKGFSYARIF